MQLFARSKFGHLHSFSSEDLVALRRDKTTPASKKGAITRILKERNGTKGYSGNLAQRRARAVNFLKLVATGARGTVGSARQQLNEVAKEMPIGECYTLGRLMVKTDTALLHLSYLVQAIEEEFPSKQKAPKNEHL